jgi:hypothetical protein
MLGRREDGIRALDAVIQVGGRREADARRLSILLESEE